MWVSDITYIVTFNGFVYLTSIMDLFSRKIISWILSRTLHAQHVVDCVNRNHSKLRAEYHYIGARSIFMIQHHYKLSV